MFTCCGRREREEAIERERECWLDGRKGGERKRKQTDLNFSAFDNSGVQCLPRRVCVRAVCECHEAESLKRRKETKALSLLCISVTHSIDRQFSFFSQRGRVEISSGITNGVRIAGLIVTLAVHACFLFVLKSVGRRKRKECDRKSSIG